MNRLYIKWIGFCRVIQVIGTLHIIELPNKSTIVVDYREVFSN